MNFKWEARDIIAEHTNGLMQSTHLERETNQDLYDVMARECSFILVDRLLEGEYTPMQYNVIRNELAEMIWKIFEPYIDEEMKI